LPYTEAMERIHLQEQQYLAGEREADIAEIRNDPEYHQDQDDPAVVEEIARQREEEAWSLAADMLDAQYSE